MQRLLELGSAGNMPRKRPLRIPRSIHRLPRMYTAGTSENLGISQRKSSKKRIKADQPDLPWDPSSLLATAERLHSARTNLTSEHDQPIYPCRRCSELVEFARKTLGGPQRLKGTRQQEQCKIKGEANDDEETSLSSIYACRGFDCSRHHGGSGGDDYSNIF